MATDYLYYRRTLSSTSICLPATIDMVEGEEAVILFATTATDRTTICYTSKSLIAEVGPVTGFIRHAYISVWPGCVGTGTVFSSRY
jgi:hypothetical protein